MIERAIGSAEIDELEAQLAVAKPDQRVLLRGEIASKSIATRVISSQTSLLVLESDADYARYGIDRKALADVLVAWARAGSCASASPGRQHFRSQRAIR